MNRWQMQLSDCRAVIYEGTSLTSPSPEERTVSPPNSFPKHTAYACYAYSRQKIKASS